MLLLRPEVGTVSSVMMVRMYLAARHWNEAIVRRYLLRTRTRIAG